MCRPGWQPVNEKLRTRVANDHGNVVPRGRQHVPCMSPALKARRAAGRDDGKAYIGHIVSGSYQGDLHAADRAVEERARASRENPSHPGGGRPHAARAQMQTGPGRRKVQAGTLHAAMRDGGVAGCGELFIKGIVDGVPSGGDCMHLANSAGYPRLQLYIIMTR